MGDRANICIKQRDGNIYLYTHWGGKELWYKLQKALARRQRWNDETFLTRIIFCEMVRDNVDGSTGFGVGVSLPDNEHPLLEVVPAERVVRIRLYHWGAPSRFGDVTASYTFEQYIELTEDPRGNPFT